MDKDQALRLALEDLKSVLCDPRGRCCINGSDADRLVVDRSLAAIKQALANDALDKMAENERELGIQMQPNPEPEPVALRQLVEQALKGDLCADSDEDLALILKARKELAEITSPPKREWQGLHPSEYCGQSSEWCEGALWAAKILKEQNT